MHSISTDAKIMPATLESIYRELKFLGSEIKGLNSLLFHEVEPEDNELNAIVEGEKDSRQANIRIGVR